MSTTFEDSSKWYSSCVGEKGHYYHREVIFPKIKEIAQITSESKIADLACGSGVLERWLPPSVDYVGMDLSPSLVADAKKRRKSKKHRFFQADITKELPVKRNDFTHVFLILALQNIDEGEKAVKNAYNLMDAKGRFIFVINHPCFRIPRQTSWQLDEENKLQFRKVNRYMTPLKIPIQTHPGKDQSKKTFSFHHPLCAYSKWLFRQNMAIEKIQELCSNKKSKGKCAKLENRARNEFPLFMLIVAKKIKEK